MNETYDVIIIGAGPGGVTAALELARAGVKRIALLEASPDIGGLSKTINYRGNRIDIGGHRFFSKSDWVMRWWQEIMPLSVDSVNNDTDAKLAYQGKTRMLSLGSLPLAESDDPDVMILRERVSRIYFDRKFFDYPLQPSIETALMMGIGRTAQILSSYARAKAKPISPELTLEDFFINRFGDHLYRTFFKEYTEKVWGVACDQISPEWGAQRVKSLSVSAAIVHALTAPLRRLGMGKKNVKTSLIEQFMYPKYGPGQMWELAVKKAVQLGVTLLTRTRVVGLDHANGEIRGLEVEDVSGMRRHLYASHVISTMPVRDLVRVLCPAPPSTVMGIGEGLQYRDFITVGLLYQRLKVAGRARSDSGACSIPDNWIYIQEPGVNVGRIQFFNNWSPYMVADRSKIWLGMEFFCKEGDDLWSRSDDALKSLGIEELERIGIADREHCEDGVVIRMPKAYPGYFGTYADFPAVRNYFDSIRNLFLVGRNGMHRYNNQDHSMLSAKLAVEAILSGSADKSPIWDVNIDDEYHEEQEQN